MINTLIKLLLRISALPLEFPKYRGGSQIWSCQSLLNSFLLRPKFRKVILSSLHVRKIWTSDVKVIASSSMLLISYTAILMLMIVFFDPVKGGNVLLYFFLSILNGSQTLSSLSSKQSNTLLHLAFKSTHVPS